MYGKLRAKGNGAVMLYHDGRDKTMVSLDTDEVGTIVGIEINNVSKIMQNLIPKITNEPKLCKINRTLERVYTLEAARVRFDCRHYEKMSDEEIQKNLIPTEVFRQ